MLASREYQDQMLFTVLETDPETQQWIGQLDPKKPLAVVFDDQYGEPAFNPAGKHLGISQGEKTFIVSLDPLTLKQSTVDQLQILLSLPQGSSCPEESLNTEAKSLAAKEGASLPVRGLEGGFDLVQTGQAVKVEDLGASGVGEDFPLITHNWKALWHGLQPLGITVKPPLADIQIFAYLIDNNLPADDVIALAEKFISATFEDPHQVNKRTRKKELRDHLDQQLQADLDFLSNQTYSVYHLYPKLLAVLAASPKVVADNTWRLWKEVEAPLQEILVRMEDSGIAASKSKIEQLKTHFGQEVEAQIAQARHLAEDPQLNLASPKQLQEVLFGKLQLPKTKKTKSGYTTNAKALQELSKKSDSPFLQAVLKYRDYVKLLQIVIGLEKSIAADGRIHTTFLQHVVATGRLSSAEPNLQNIPARTPAGQQIREIFVPGPGYESLMSVDYSQIEMRIMAHLSEDTHLIAAIKSGEDLHRSMAAMVFGLPLDQVSASDRSRVKATSYGLAYGLSAYGLSQQLDLTPSEAQKLMDRYFERFGKVKEYLGKVVDQALETGYTETMFGRRRYLVELESDQRTVRESAKRAALNAPIQGSAADMMKMAMIQVDRQLRSQGLKSRVLLQIHDELILEIAAGEAEEVKQLVSQAMTQVVQLRVPLSVGIGIGNNLRSAGH